ncbi:TOBE domain-containing protein [Eggerthella sinensis]|mgnify:FL=1|jgi:molybdopterin-binding protein|uniref:Molybdenum-pterin-binding protein n=1 Tax=Eggerthella sinensis TaxID=242230 RepID=A0A3N0J338_9ACTN|nr:molybdopterin-binding protein [Eggerthella sinensis]MCB7038382.1 molybdopterin-binding protein [Eggerthella sinensis]RDB71397.1 molybdenum-pterin-binding protein [Eggerthella sinensis]RNM43396.1 molybdenum-pterin-binding protein [Eggerthella sinensis]
MKLSARNQLKGTVTAIHPGAVNAIVILELDGGQLVTSSISMGSLKDLDLQVGQTAYAIVKASNVIIGVDD